MTSKWFRLFLQGSLLALAMLLDGLPAQAAAEKAAASSAMKPVATIARVWRGRTSRAKADEYQKYLYAEGVLWLKNVSLGVEFFREDRANETEFIVTSFWESVPAMARFTGGDPTKINNLPRDAEFLLEMPKSVQILQIVTDEPGLTGK